MHEVIARVMEAEAEARRIVGEAKAEADRILSVARDEARQLSVRVRKDTQSEADRLVEKSVQTARQEKEDELARYSRELEARLPLDASSQVSAVTLALECVCNPEPVQKI